MGPITLSLKLGLATLVWLMPLSLLLARGLAGMRSRWKPWLEGLFALPLVLPPTVLGYYLMVALGHQNALTAALQAWWGHPLVFSFEGLVLASVLVNLPFAIQPMQRAFESIPLAVQEAAKCCGLSPWQRLHLIEWPLAWPGVVSAAVLSFAHTLGEFGVVLMVGGNIPGETRTMSIAIYDETQSLNPGVAAPMAAMLLLVSLAAMAATYGWANRRLQRTPHA